MSDEGHRIAVSELRYDDSRSRNNRLGSGPSLGRQWIGRVPCSADKLAAPRASTSDSITDSNPNASSSLGRPSTDSPIGISFQTPDAGSHASVGRQLLHKSLSQSPLPSTTSMLETKSAQYGQLSVNSPATKEAIEYGEALAFHAMEHGDLGESSDVLLEGFAAITAEKPEASVKCYLKKVHLLTV